MKKLCIIGNLGQDSKVNEVNGRKVINFSVAINESYTDAQGVKIEKTTWVSCSYFRDNNASLKIADYLKKGTQVYIEGNPSVDMYKDNNGQYNATLRCMVNTIQLLGSAPSNNNNAQSTPQAAGEQHNHQAQSMPSNTEFANPLF